MLLGTSRGITLDKCAGETNPQMTCGRFQELFQCDFDIAGDYAIMVPDSEVVKVLVEILTELDLGEFEIRLNHRR